MARHQIKWQNWRNAVVRHTPCGSVWPLKAPYGFPFGSPFGTPSGSHLLGTLLGTPFALLLVPSLFFHFFCSPFFASFLPPFWPSFWPSFWPPFGLPLASLWPALSLCPFVPSPSYCPSSIVLRENCDASDTSTEIKAYKSVLLSQEEVESRGFV